MGTLQDTQRPGAGPPTAVVHWHRSAPALLIAGFAFLLPIQFETGGPVARFAPSDLFLLAYAAMRFPRLRYVRAAWSTWVLALVAVIVLGALVALLRTGALLQYAVVQKGAGLLVLLTLYVCVVDFCRDWDRVRWLLRVFLLGVVLNAGVSVVAALLVNVGGPTIPLLNQPFPGVRLSGLLIDPNAFGGIIGVALAIHAITAMNGVPILGRRWSTTATVVLPVALVMTFSRSAWIGVSLGLFVALLLRPLFVGRMLARLAGPVLVLTPVLITLLLLAVPDALQLAARPSEVASRVSIGADAVDEVLMNPVFGVGLGAYLMKYDIIVHNTSLWILTEFGAIGLLVFAGFVLSYFAKLLTATRLGEARQRPVLIALMAGHTVMIGVSMGIEALYQRPWWLVLALAGSAYAVVRAESERRSEPPATTQALSASAIAARTKTRATTSERTTRADTPRGR